MQWQQSDSHLECAAVHSARPLCALGPVDVDRRQSIITTCHTQSISADSGICTKSARQLNIHQTFNSSCSCFSCSIRSLSSRSFSSRSAMTQASSTGQKHRIQIYYQLKNYLKWFELKFPMYLPLSVFVHLPLFAVSPSQPCWCFLLCFLQTGFKKYL